MSQASLCTLQSLPHSAAQAIGIQRVEKSAPADYGADTQRGVEFADGAGDGKIGNPKCVRSIKRLYYFAACRLKKTI